MMYNKIIVSASAIAGCIAVQVEGKDKDNNKVAKKCVVSALALLGSAQAMDFTEDLKSFETFNAPDIIEKAGWTEQNTVYPETMSVKIPFQGEELEVKLAADRALFAEDWSLVDGSTGETISTDKEAHMCHYIGQVKGKPGSYVNLSVCNDSGMTGFIHTDEFDAEIRPKDIDAISQGESVIYNMNDLELPADIKFGHAVAAYEDFAASGALNGTDDTGAARAYTMNLVTASDSWRMNGQSSEASNTQSIVSQMNSRYTATSWGSGNSLRIVLQTQVQNANLSPTTNLSSYLPRVATWKGNFYPNSDNVQGLTHISGGGVIGVAYLTTMCQRSNSAGINNVGFTSSTSTRGILVAHEAGHNFAMNHDNSQTNVMSSSINSNAQRFTTFSVNEFLSRSPKTCL